jgi:hypothetical protein
LPPLALYEAFIVNIEVYSQADEQEMEVACFGM